jgi:alkanesulfonate monooxygenase SsuD/methylene tetrahydromethanopterin reductase-like flavin-dependent oxidoreductase (luciferase family)
MTFGNFREARPDTDMYAGELALADLVEPLGFDSLWGVEHHFTDYAVCPDVLQFLSYMAGRTERVQLGSMVVVLPWHDPLRVAEQVSLLDHLCGGRLILGLGRGAGRVEFDAFSLDMAESRPRFIEYAQMLLDGLESGYCEFEGEFLNQPRAPIRPAPFKSFEERTYVGSLSPDSAPSIAQLGAGILLLPQKPWEHVARELANYRQLFLEAQGTDAPPPIFGGWVFCDEDAERAAELGRRYVGDYWQSLLDHYQFDTDHLATQKGYEYYGKIRDTLEEKGADAMTEFFVDLQIVGTPEQCREQIEEIASMLGAGSFVGIFSYAGMPFDEAERNMRLFAERVMPELRAVSVELPGAATPARP